MSATLHTVRNRTAAPVQITAEQILREAQNYSETKLVAPIQHIQNATELQQYKTDQRTSYENRLRSNVNAITVWIKYAQFELKLHEFDRMRSIYERALNNNYTSVSVWLAYAHSELSYKFINHARNIYDRAVVLLPLQNSLWQKYTYMEEILDNIAGARAIYERWMSYQPNIQYWYTYINFEIRHNNISNANQLYERLTVIQQYNTVDTYIKWHKFQLQHGTVQDARGVYERALAELPSDDVYSSTFLNSFAEFEISQHEYQRVRAIYKYALNKLSKQESLAIFQRYVQFEKQYGTINDIEYTVLQNKIYEYNELIELNPYDYDHWLDYIKMLIDTNYNQTIICELFERSLIYAPPIHTKPSYKRYIYLYVYYALYTELVLNDSNKAQTIYKRAIQHTTQHKLYFAKLYINAAMLEIRLLDLSTARQLLGTGIGVCHKKYKIFKYYIELELQLGNIDRCRSLYERQLSLYATQSSIWLAYIQLEYTLQEYNRVRALYQLLIQQNNIDDITAVYNSYIKFEIEQHQYDTVRTLYQQYINQCGHTYTLYQQYIDYEINITRAIDRARNVYTDADKYYKSNSSHAYDRYQLIHSWNEFELLYGTLDQQQFVQSKHGTTVKKRREIKNMDTGDIDGYEEYIDYIFADDIDTKKSITMSLLLRAKQWKQQQDERILNQPQLQSIDATAHNQDEIDIGG